MKNLLISMFLKMVSVETIDKMLVAGIAKLLDTAHQKGGDWWDKSKKVVHHVAVATSLFDKVYEDDKMSPEEEQEIIDALKESGFDDKLENLLSKITDQAKTDQ